MPNFGSIGGGTASIPSDVSVNSATANFFQLNTGASPPSPSLPGQFWWDIDNKTFAARTGIAEDVIIQVGQETYILVENGTGSTITNGQACYISGVDGVVPIVMLAQSDQLATAIVAGIATHDILPGDTGLITVFGAVRSLDTSSWAGGNRLWLSDTVAGGLQNTAPPTPAKRITIALVVKSDPSDGIILVQTNFLLDVGPSNFKSYTFTSQGVGAGTYYNAGFYEAPAAAATLTQASPSVTVGSANNAYAAHAFIVPSGPGTTDAGTVKIQVQGTSINDAGTLTPGDTEDIVADITTLTTDAFAESPKKWLGTTTIALVASGGATAYSVTINYGLAKYEDFGNVDFTVTDFEAVGLAGANDTSFELELIHHKGTGWTYSAAAFSPGPQPAICSWIDTYTGSEKNLVNGEQFAYKRTGLNTFINGEALEGVIIKIVTGANNSVQVMDEHIGVDVA